MWVYALFALATIGVTMLLLLITKIPVVVILSAATVCSSALILISRLELGYWDPFTAIAWVTSWGFAFAVSFVFLGVGSPVGYASRTFIDAVILPCIGKWYAVLPYTALCEPV